jgi:adenine-specific DNA-methyltransferase
MIDERDNELISKGYNRYASVSNGELLENTYTRQKLIQLFEDEALIFKPDSIYEKDFNTNKRVKSIITSSEKFDVKTETAGSVIGELAKYFDFPKNTGLIKALLSLIDSRDCLVMDFFSGSATTAHAVMQINAEDGGSRKWIMVQLPEVTDEGSEAYKSGYKTIPEISRERIRRAGDKIAKEHPDAKVDYGFRSLTIAETNYKDVYKPAHTTTQQELLSTVDNVKEDRSELDLLYGVLTASAMELNRGFEKLDINGSNVYVYDYQNSKTEDRSYKEKSGKLVTVANQGLIACFDQNMTEETIKEIAKMEPTIAVFRDSAFPDSQAKVNLSEHFRIISPDTKVKVI